MPAKTKIHDCLSCYRYDIEREVCRINGMAPPKEFICAAYFCDDPDKRDWIENLKP